MSFGMLLSKRMPTSAMMTQKGNVAKNPASRQAFSGLSRASRVSWKPDHTADNGPDLSPGASPVAFIHIRSPPRRQSPIMTTPPAIASNRNGISGVTPLTRRVVLTR